MTISNEAVDAAVKAWDHYWGDRYGDEALDEMGEEVRVALAAAAPHIAAQALRDAAEELELQPPKLKAQYVSTLRLYADEPWRLARADRIGGGE